MQDLAGRSREASVSRRDVLKLAGGAIAGAGLRELDPQPSPRRAAKRVIVAGGGIGGLCCAYELVRRGHDVTVLEAAGRTGGHVRTIRDPLGRRPLRGRRRRALHAARLRDLLGLREGVRPRGPPLPAPQQHPPADRRQLRTEEMLADPKVLSGLGFNPREIEFLGREPWWKLPALYYAPYLDAFKDEYRPFDAGLDHLDGMTLSDRSRRTAPPPPRSASSATRGSRHCTSSGTRPSSSSAACPFFRPRCSASRAATRRCRTLSRSASASACASAVPVTGIERGDTGVRVRYREAGKDKTMEADWLVSRDVARQAARGSGDPGVARGPPVRGRRASPTTPPPGPCSSRARGSGRRTRPA